MTNFIYCSLCGKNCGCRYCCGKNCGCMDDNNYYCKNCCAGFIKTLSACTTFEPIENTAEVIFNHKRIKSNTTVLIAIRSKR